MKTTLEDLPNLDENTTLQYFVSFRNCCLYVRGFTPAQLVIGPDLPSDFHDSVPGRMHHQFYYCTKFECHCCCSQRICSLGNHCESMETFKTSS